MKEWRAGERGLKRRGDTVIGREESWFGICGWEKWNDIAVLEFDKISNLESF